MTYLDAQPDPLHRTGGKVKDKGPQAGAAAKTIRQASQDASGSVGDFPRLKGALTRYAGGVADDSQGLGVSFHNGGGNIEYVAGTVRNLDNEEGRTNQSAATESEGVRSDISATITRSV